MCSRDRSLARAPRGESPLPVWLASRPPIHPGPSLRARLCQGTRCLRGGGDRDRQAKDYHAEGRFEFPTFGFILARTSSAADKTHNVGFETAPLLVVTCKALPQHMRVRGPAPPAVLCVFSPSAVRAPARVRKIVGSENLVPAFGRAMGCGKNPRAGVGVWRRHDTSNDEGRPQRRRIAPSCTLLQMLQMLRTQLCECVRPAQASMDLLGGRGL